ncbi:3-phosphoshikimate 1-carboxyvinyltransferase [Vagococcus coleopterorum]|uniref:3-phosphoshikimate 1-carboxyvinyltransferase n=1 Tax=Vagococcus coleopterorum TaxID=2714946 RepID=A0A6G8ANL3_9ENTE|nr:3-phosphoshikimate 1-carboxyvinyltransferase [Vagococcus coleopterorum]
MQLKIASKGLKGEFSVPGDKSISHRSVMLASLATGETQIEGFLAGEDCLATIEMFRELGVVIEIVDQKVKVISDGHRKFSRPAQPIDVGNSGTTMRLGLGILASLPYETTITGDSSLVKRPMERVMGPLREMGATVSGANGTEYAPINTVGTSDLKGIDYTMPVASAQVKSAILLAGLFAQGETVVREQVKSRNHTEEMLKQFGVDVKNAGTSITIKGQQPLKTPGGLNIPGDISSAAFFMVAAVIIPNSCVKITNVGLNETRTGIIDVLKAMGAKITVEVTDSIGQIGTVTVSSSDLHGITISGEIIPRLIDELPIIALLATQATGQTVIADAEELKHKETNRIDVTASELRKLGADIQTTSDGLIIKGKTELTARKVSSHGDHRIGMTLAIAALLVQVGEVELEQADAVAVSYPNFFKDLENIMIGGL